MHSVCRATGRRSNESIELQPLHLQKGPKGVLRRMPRVRSDEIQETPADQAQHTQAHTHEKDKTPSPIGAGLPLLQRLRLLKEKQVSSHLIHAAHMNFCSEKFDKFLGIFFLWFENAFIFFLFVLKVYKMAFAIDISP